MQLIFGRSLPFLHTIQVSKRSTPSSALLQGRGKLPARSIVAPFKMTFIHLYITVLTFGLTSSFDRLLARYLLISRLNTLQVPPRAWYPDSKFKCPMVRLFIRQHTGKQLQKQKRKREGRNRTYTQSIQAPQTGEGEKRMLLLPSLDSFCTPTKPPC